VAKIYSDIVDKQLQFIIEENDKINYNFNNAVVSFDDDWLKIPDTTFKKTVDIFGGTDQFMNKIQTIINNL
jgi:hypothetical protein